MNRWLKKPGWLVIGFVLILFALLPLFIGIALNRKSGQGDPVLLEHEIRAGLPLGTSASAVDQYLSERRIEHRFEPTSKSVVAIIRKVNGSTALVRHDLSLNFHFDESLKLTAIDAKVVYTGP